MLLQFFSHFLVRGFIIVKTVFMEENNRLRINKIKAEVFCQNQRIQIFSAACRKITSGMVHNGIANILQLTRNIKIQIQIANNIVIPLCDLCKIIDNILSVVYHLIATVKHIGNLYISRKTLARCRGNNKPAGRIGFYNCGDLAKLFRVRQRRTAKFYNFHLCYILSKCFYFAQPLLKKAIYLLLYEICLLLSRVKMPKGIKKDTFFKA